MLEVLAISTLVFVVLTEFTAGVSILLFSAIFIVQILINIFDNKHCYIYRHRHEDMSTEEPNNNNNNNNSRGFCSLRAKIFCSVIAKLLAFFLQFSSILGLVGFLVYRNISQDEPINFRPVIGMPISFFVLSIVWSNRFQETITASGKCGVSARYKSSNTKLIQLSYTSKPMTSFMFTWLFNFW